MLNVAGQLIGLIAAVSYSGLAVDSSSSSPLEVETGSEFTDLPPRVGLTLEQIRSTYPHPMCLRDDYPTELVLQAYYVQQPYVGDGSYSQPPQLVCAETFDSRKRPPAVHRPKETVRTVWNIDHGWVDRVEIENDRWLGNTRTDLLERGAPIGRKEEPALRDDDQRAIFRWVRVSKERKAGRVGHRLETEPTIRGYKYAT